MGRSMIITYFRSSAIGTREMCNMKQYLVYVLGEEELGASNKADLGTAVHKVMEVLAILKKGLQDTGADSYSYIDEHLGEISATKEELYCKTTLSDEDVDKINKSRKAKTVYKFPCNIEKGHIRM